MGRTCERLVGIAGLTAIVVASSKAMASGQKRVMKGATKLNHIWSGYQNPGVGVRIYQDYKWDELGRGLTGVGVLFAEIAVFLRVAKIQRENDQHCNWNRYSVGGNEGFGVRLQRLWSDGVGEIGKGLSWNRWITCRTCCLYEFGWKCKTRECLLA